MKKPRNFGSGAEKVTGTETLATTAATLFYREKEERLSLHLHWTQLEQSTSSSASVSYHPRNLEKKWQRWQKKHKEMMPLFSTLFES
jgi:hypothetical protein